MAESMDIQNGYQGAGIEQVYTWEVLSPPPLLPPAAEQSGLVVAVTQTGYLPITDRAGKWIITSSLDPVKQVFLYAGGKPLAFGPGTYCTLGLVEPTEAFTFFERQLASAHARDAITKVGGTVVLEKDSGIFTAHLPVTDVSVSDLDRANLALRSVGATFVEQLMVDDPIPARARAWAREHGTLVRKYLGITEQHLPNQPELLDVFTRAVATLMTDDSIEHRDALGRESIPTVVDAAEAFGTLRLLLHGRLSVGRVEDIAFRDAVLDRLGELSALTSIGREGSERLHNHDARLLLNAMKWHVSSTRKAVEQAVSEIESRFMPAQAVDALKTALLDPVLHPLLTDGLTRAAASTDVTFAAAVRAATRSLAGSEAGLEGMLSALSPISPEPTTTHQQSPMTLS